MKVYREIAMLIALSFALILVQAGVTKDKGERCGRCGPHAQWLYNGIPPNCVKTCATRNIQFKCQATNSSACYCDENYIRESKDGSCILLSDCPPLMNETKTCD